MDDMEYKMVIIMRADLKLSKGKIAAQAAHAAVNCAFASKKNDSKTFDKWYSEGQRKVVLKVPDLQTLFEIKVMADVQNVTNSIIADAGRTEIPAGTITCMGLGPGKGTDIDKITGELQML